MKTGVATLWIGKRLSPLERLSLTSLVNHDHRVTLYSYRPVDGVPKGVICRDAAEILSGDPIIRYRASGSPALHSDFFRVSLMRKTPDVWVDADVIAVDRFPLNDEYILSFASKSHVGNAVMRLPENSSTLRSLDNLFRRGHGYPPQWSRFKTVSKSIRAGQFRVPLEDWPYGGTGPMILTQYLRQTGEVSRVMPQNTFFPVDYENCRDLILPNGLTAAKLPSECRGVHCFAKGLKKMIIKSQAGIPPQGSFLREQFECHSVDPFPAAAWHPEWNRAN